MATHRKFACTLLILICTATSAQTQAQKPAQTQAQTQTTDSPGLSPRAAIGVSMQSRGYSAGYGLSLRAGVSNEIVPQLRWGVDIALERFGRATGNVYAPCPVGDACSSGPDGALTLASLGLELRWGEFQRATAYMIGGGGVTRMLERTNAPARSYAHVTGGIGWMFPGEGPTPFFELRLINYLAAHEPMSRWSFPVVFGFRF